MRRGVVLTLAGLLLTAAAEIVVFLLVAQVVGGLWAVLALLACCAAGLVLLRREGVRGWRGFRAAAAGGQPPGRQVTDGLVGLAGALLVAVPGFLSGVAGAVLLLPPGRQLAGRAVERSMAARVSAAAAGDMFGPRRVRVRRGAPMVDDPPVVPRTGEVLEGEVVDRS